MSRERDDHVIMELVPSKTTKTGKAIRVTTPSQVLAVHSKEELEELLKFYSRPFIRHLTPDSHFARRWHVEKVRPALRYYCKKFGVKVPAWLENDDYYKNLPDEEKMDLFGTTTLSHREFRPLRSFPGGTVKRGGES